MSFSFSHNESPLVVSRDLKSLGRTRSTGSTQNSTPFGGSGCLKIRKTASEGENENNLIRANEPFGQNRGAYFSTVVKPGLKVISLNMNYCNNQNWWLLLNTTDPADELTWLIHELQSSELLEEKVLIIGHIAPGGNDCLQVWSQNYYRIINRYESTISAQFFGHSHTDEFQLFYDEAAAREESVMESKARFALIQKSFDRFRPTNVAYISPSVTTFGGVNPGYRIYTIHPETFEILDHETYFANLTAANIAGSSAPLTFQLSYRAKETYGFTSCSPLDWHLLVLRMAKDDGLFQKFQKLKHNQSDHYKKCEEHVCKADALCDLVTAKAHDYSMCQKFLSDSDLLTMMTSLTSSKLDKLIVREEH